MRWHIDQAGDSHSGLLPHRASLLVGDNSLTSFQIVVVKASLWTLSFFVNFEAATWDDNLVGGLDFVSNSVLQVPFFLMSLMRYITPTLDHMYEFSIVIMGCH